MNLNNQKEHNGKVSEYFNKASITFDTFYGHQRCALMQWIDRRFRSDIFERYRLTFEAIEPLKDKVVLDVGCGTGRYSIECAKRGASRIVGIDFAPSMIDFSQEIAEQMNVAGKCEFICDNFLTHPFEESFDIVLALGVFDYIKEPEPIFKKIAALSPHKFVASFPKYSLFWNIQRKFRYHWIKKCPIYNYTAEQLERLYNETAFQHHQIIPCKRGYFGVAGTE